MRFPEMVRITEVGPRDGLQMEQRLLPTATKLDLIAGLADAGLTAIQVAAFVHPGKVPSMADAEALIAALPRDDKVDYSALTLNLRGVERACRTAVPWIEISLSASDIHSQRNAGISADQALGQIGPMSAAAARAGRKVRASIQCAFGYDDPADVPLDQVARAAAILVDQGADMLVLADTTGMAAPPALSRMIETIMPLVGAVPVGLHLHDTRGLGLVNVMTALGLGVSHFDTSLGGLGGCPFIDGAAGNIATEDTLYLLGTLGIETGVDIGKVAAWSRGLSDLFGRPLPGKIHRLPQFFSH